MSEPGRNDGMENVDFCVCVRCGHRQPHERGRPCLESKCPACGAALLREGSWHHQQYLSKRRRTDETP